MRRPILKTATFLAITLLIAVVTSYLLLRTALPGKWILEAASARLGLDVTAESLSVGWLGDTRIRNVKVTMPLSEEEVLSAAEISLSHRALPWLLLTRSLGMGSVRVDSPNLQMRRDSAGRWNVQDVWTRLSASREPDRRPHSQVALPEIEVHGATVRLRDANGVTETIGPLDFGGRPQNRSLWLFTLQTQPQIEVQGQVAPGHDWAHAVGFDIKAVEPLLRALHGPNVSPLQVAGQWEGRVAKDELTGRLVVDQLRFGKLVLEGTVSVTAGPDGVILRPAVLEVSEPNIAGAPVRWTSGTLRIGAAEIRAERVAVRTGNVFASLDGHWNHAAETGALTASWRATAGDDPAYRGTCRIVVKSSPGQKEAEVDLTAKGTAAGGTGSLTAKIRGAGGSWQDSEWALSIPGGVWGEGKKRLDLSGARAEVALDWPTVRLTTVQLPNAAEVQAQGQFDAVTMKWAAQIGATGLRAEPWADGPLNLHLNAQGDSREVTLTELVVTQSERTATLRGQLSLADRSVRTAHLLAQWPASAGGAAAAPGKVGRWRYEADASGPLRPMALQVKGVLSGTNVRLGRQIIDQVEVTVRADVNDTRITATSEPFRLLDGQWRISGRHDRSESLTQLGLLVEELSLKSAADMAGSPLTCRGQGRAELQLTIPDFDLHEAVAFGSWSATDVEVSPFRADNAQGQLRIANGLVKFDEIRLVQSAGQAQGRMQFRLDRPQHVSASFETSSWPIRLENRRVELRLDGMAEAQLDVVAKTMNGRGHLSGSVWWHDETYGQMNLSAAVQERTLVVQEFQAEGLGGRVTGTARIPLDQWAQSSGQLAWQGIEPNALAAAWPTASRFAGRLSGSLVATQTEGQKRAPEPMRLELQTQMSDGRFGSAQLQSGRILAYLGPRRLLLDRADFLVLDGHVQGRARVSPHVGKLYTTISMDVNDIDLPQLVQTINPQAGQIVGRVGGKGTLLFASDLSSLSGQADLTLSQSDLVNSTVIRTLYNTLNLNLGSTKPEGTGQLRLQLDDFRMKMASFVYFNGGVEIRGAGEIENMRLGSASPVDGYAFGSTRVLRGIALPGVKELDNLMTSLQTGAASVEVNGTLAEPKAAVVPLPILSDPLRRLLWAQLRSGQQNQREP